MSIELRNVVKTVGAETHIYETDITLEAGQFNILLGTTLSGKTTLMRLMAGLEKPSQGEVWCEGQNVTGVAVQKRNVAMVYQAFINYPNFSVYNNIASPLKVAGVKPDEIKQRVGKIAELMKLTPYLDRLPGELSGGQQQRTALARALVKEAELVLLDEPLANLDYKLREELRDELPKLFADTGATVVYATSEPHEALLLGGYTATLHQGRVIQFGQTPEVYHHPDNLQSAAVFSDPPINTASIEKRGDRVFLSDEVNWTAPSHITALDDGTYNMGLRPHHIRPNGKGTEVEAHIQIAEITGSDSIIRLNVEGNNWVSESSGIHSFGVGDKAKFLIDTERCLYFDQNDQFIGA